jgi:hypothetical protein
MYHQRHSSGTRDDQLGPGGPGVEQMGSASYLAAPMCTPVIIIITRGISDDCDGVACQQGKSNRSVGGDVCVHSPGSATKWGNRTGWESDTATAHTSDLVT